MAFQIVKASRDGKDDKNYSFEMEILDEGAPDKYLTVELIDAEYFKQSDVEFPKEFLSTCKI